MSHDPFDNVHFTSTWYKNFPNAFAPIKYLFFKSFDAKITKLEEFLHYKWSNSTNVD